MIWRRVARLRSDGIRGQKPWSRMLRRLEGRATQGVQIGRGTGFQSCRFPHDGIGSYPTIQSNPVIEQCSASKFRLADTCSVP